MRHETIVVKLLNDPRIFSYFGEKHDYRIVIENDNFFIKDFTTGEIEFVTQLKNIEYGYRICELVLEEEKDGRVICTSIDN